MRGFDDEDLDALCQRRRIRRSRLPRLRARSADGRRRRLAVPTKLRTYGLSGAATSAANDDDDDDPEDLQSSTAADHVRIDSTDRQADVVAVPVLHDCGVGRSCKWTRRCTVWTPLPWCRFGRVTVNGATVSCCNPYHYALWTRRECILRAQCIYIVRFVVWRRNGGRVSLSVFG